jgi:hypothetical protein
MKKISTVCLLAVCFCALASAQEKPAAGEQQLAMEAYLKAGALNENHEFLKKMAGSWDVQVTSWMAPGQPPSVSKSTVQADIRLGGRYLVMSFVGAMFGQPFEGLQIVGYDNMEKRYTTFWIDNTSTHFYTTAGQREGNVISETGSWLDPLNGSQVPVKAKTTLVSADEYLYQQFMVMPDGSEFKSMENRCRRKK